MARIERVLFRPHALELVQEECSWVPLTAVEPEYLPQIFWCDNAPWREANVWLLRLSNSSELSTVNSYATSLHAYAQWLELTVIPWWHFPAVKDERCLFRYRKALKQAIGVGQLAPTTASSRLRVAVRFYRWLKEHELLSPELPLWRDKPFGVRLTDTWGFDRTMQGVTTDLRIPLRGRSAAGLEDGLVPVSDEFRESISQVAMDHCTPELSLMLMLGFATGMRLGTICDLKIATLLDAIPDPLCPNAFLITIGPDAAPPVHTKFGTCGQIAVPKVLFDNLISYARSARRMRRQTLAAGADASLLFLTRFGRPYVNRTHDRSRAVNVEMCALRKHARSVGVKVGQFKFHQTRATFACDAMRVALDHGCDDPVGFVRDLLFHKNRHTTEQYLKYLKRQPLKAALSNAFTQHFLGILERVRGPDASASLT